MIRRGHREKGRSGVDLLKKGRKGTEREEIVGWKRGTKGKGGKPGHREKAKEGRNKEGDLETK